MLRDLPDGWRPPYDPFLDMLREFSEGSRNARPVRVHRGVYLAHINFDKEIDATGLLVDHWPSFDLRRRYEDIADSFSCFGVVDHWTQLPLRYLDDDPRSLLVFLGHHVKADQSETGGWRWHKWGPYLGMFQEQVAENEYLYDTPDVLEVWSYQIVEIRGSMNADVEGREEK